MPPAFIEANKDFVLKLNIQTTSGATQVRRIRLPRIDDGSGNVSYDELVGIAVTFIFPDDGSIEEPEKYRIVLSYTDVDNDIVTIASSDELVDAIEQFADACVLRISAEVRESRKGKPNRASSVCSSSFSTSFSEASAAASSEASAPTKPAARSTPVRPVLQTLASVISAAVASSKSAPDGSSTPEDKPTGNFKTEPSIDEAVAEAAQFASSIAEDARQFCDEIHRASVASSCDEPPSTAGVPEDEGVQEKTETKIDGKEAVKTETTHEPEESAMKPEAEAPPKNQSEEEEEEPFIHARHTCDGCLCTPLVGKRYHAKNIADYDLCAKCYSNYSGTEFEFEAVELDRDRPFQEKWRRRRAKIMARSGRGRGHKGRGGRYGVRGRLNKPTLPHPTGPFAPPPPHHPPHVHGPPPPFGPPHMHGAPPPFGPPPHAHGPPPPFGPPPHAHGPPPSFGPQGRNFGPFSFPNPFSGGRRTADEDEDEAFKEAVRRSLVENLPKSAENADAPKPKSTEDEVSKENVADVEDVASEPTVPVELFPAVIVGADERIAEKLQAEEPQAPEPNASESENAAPLATAPIVAGVETVTDDDSVAMTADDVTDLKPAARPKTNPKTIPYSPGSESFASDAAGNGEAAVAIGETLDTFAGIIDEMMLGEDAPASTDSNTSVAESKPESVSVAASGTVIVESTGDEGGDILLGPADSLSDAASSEHGWHVVTEDGSVDGSKAGDDLGGAALALGSALYNSDMRSSEELISHLSNSSCSDSFSSASSVPSTLPSLSLGAGPAGSAPVANKRERWEPQLTKLREIGFVNEDRCIEIMESLEAANIGVGSTDPITVAQVIHRMYE